MKREKGEIGGADESEKLVFVLHETHETYVVCINERIFENIRKKKVNSVPLKGDDIAPHTTRTKCDLLRRIKKIGLYIIPIASCPATDLGD